MHTFASCLFVVGLTVAAVYDRRDMNECGIERIPLLASPQGGVAERLRRFREASADREAGVVFRFKTKRKTSPAAGVWFRAKRFQIKMEIRASFVMPN